MVLYNVPAPDAQRNSLWHQCRILGAVAPLVGTEHSHLYVVLTPDKDVYLEDYGGRTQNIAAVRFSVARRTLPGGIPAGNTYRFREAITDGDLAVAQALAEEAAEEWWRKQGGAQPAAYLRPAGGPRGPNFLKIP